MSALKAIGYVIAGMWFLMLVSCVGFGVAVTKIGHDLERGERSRRPIPEASAEDYRRGRLERDREMREMMAEYEREREGVTIDSDSAKPMVDLEHR